jgi:hypothetical protein
VFIVFKRPRLPANGKAPFGFCSDYAYPDARQSVRRGHGYWFRRRLPRQGYRVPVSDKFGYRAVLASPAGIRARPVQSAIYWLRHGGKASKINECERRGGIGEREESGLFPHIICGRICG